LVYAPSGPSTLPSAAPFAGCEQLFTRYPLAAAPHSPGDGPRSMVLITRAAGEARFFILSETEENLFYIRAWDRRGEAIQEVTPGGPVPDVFARVIADGMPVPRDRAVLGWVADRQVTAILEVHSGHPAGPGTTPAVPAIHVMPMSGTTVLDWPPFAASPLSDGRLWDYLDRGDLVDIVARARVRARRCMRRCHGGPGGPRILAARRRLHRPLDAARGHSRPAGPAAARTAGHRGPGT
jgi:hypothetical protein